jgi:hypothetical protein
MASESRILRKMEKQAREILAMPNTPLTRCIIELAERDLQLVLAARELLSTKTKGKVM